MRLTRFVNNNAKEGLIQAANSRGGFASTSFIGNTVSSAGGAVLSLTDGSLFLGSNALFRDNVGGDLRAEDSHFRVDKSLFKGSALNLEQVAEKLISGDIGAGQNKVMEGSGAEEPAGPLEGRVRRRLQAEEGAAEPAPQVATAEQEGSVARLYGASSFRGFNNFFDGTQGPAVLALDASNVTLGRPCFTNDAPGAEAGADGARFVEAGALDGNLTLWGACAFPTTDNVSTGVDGIYVYMFVVVLTHPLVMHAQNTALYGAADVAIDGMEAESVALTPFSPLAIGGEVRDAHLHKFVRQTHLCLSLRPLHPTGRRHHAPAERLLRQTLRGGLRGAHGLGPRGAPAPREEEHRPDLHLQVGAEGRDPPHPHGG